VGAYERLQERLGDALAVNEPGSTVDHVVVALPSYSMSERLMALYASRLAALEHRFLMGALQTAQIPGAHVVLVASAHPSDVVLDYYARLARPDCPDATRSRISCLVVDDPGPRSVAAKLLDRPELIAELRQRIGGRPALIEAWNVTADEAAVALALDVPVNGSRPDLWRLGFKSASRRLFELADVPVPLGVGDIRDRDGVADAIAVLRERRPDLDRVVVKVDDSGSGEGNWVVATRNGAGRPLPIARLRSDALAGAPSWFSTDLSSGGVVEELVTGRLTASPSALADIRPDGEIRLLATHEQVLGGDNGQVFTGSRLPADTAYAADLARHVVAVAQVLARVGAVGRIGVDFVAVRRPDGWALHALDLNLRKGGTTYPFAALRHIVPGRYDAEAGRWVARSDGRPRCYRSSDAVLSPRWTGMDPATAIRAVDRAGLSFQHDSGTGVVLHMMSALGFDGRIGVTAIGRTATDADHLFAAVPHVLDAAAGLA
jgi:hypothetical protein